jgi:putative chitinase
MNNVPAGAVISLALIRSVVGKMTKAQTDNATSVVVALQNYGDGTGLDQPHRLAQYLAQTTHESGAFAYDREVWGPTKAQKGYEGRKDLGNTQPGDGKRFSGRTGIQITGRANTRSFRDWCRKLMPGTSVPVPDFERNPDAMLTDPWEGLGPIWYWDTRGLNRYADQGDIEMITRKVNGGTNGLDDRIKWYARYALVMLGFGPNDIIAFQKKAGVKLVDGVPGPRTRAALHNALVALTAPVLQASDVQAAPVVEEKEVEKPTVPDAVDQQVKEKVDWWTKLTGGGGIGALGIGGILGADWQAILAGGLVLIVVLIVLLCLRHQIVAAVNEIRGAVEG